MKIVFKQLYYLLPAILFYNQALSQSTAYQTPCAELIWADEFNGNTLDATKWTPQIGDGCPNLCGWGNAELQYYTDRPENVKVENGKLIITSVKESMGGKDYSSARLRTINQGDFTFGRIEARIKLPEGAGSWSAFWMLPTDNVYGAWAASGEIDIMEFQGKNPSMVSGTIHYGEEWPLNKYKGGWHYLNPGQYYYDDFHVYAIEWDSTEIRWYMDNVNYAKRSLDEIFPDKWPFDQRFHIILNNAIGGHLGGTPNDAFFPMTMEVDYVRVYSNPLNRKLHGNKNVLEGKTETYYIAHDNLDVTYTWTVPSDATIISGQGTNAVTVQWGATSGDVSLEIERACGILNLNFPVKVFSNNSCSVIYNDFGLNKNITKYISTSPLNDFANPAPDTVNNSIDVGRYRRSLLAKDSIVFNNIISQDFSLHESGMKSFYLDINTAAVSGTVIELQLRNHLKSKSGSGTRSTYRAYTSLQNKWEKLKFEPISINENEVNLNEIDEIALFVDPDFINQSLTTRLYFFDNFIDSKLTADTIIGNSTVTCQTQGETYHVNQETGESYYWQVPSDAIIVSGQHTNQITLNWGRESRNLSLLKKDSDGCIAISDQLFVTVAGCPTSTTKPLDYLGIKIYPNPVQNNLLIVGSKPFGELTLINSIGKEILHQTISSSSAEINMSNFPDGIYFIKINNGESVVLEKIIKGQ